MAQLFISYSGYDEEESFALAEWLNEQGWQDFQMGQSPIWKEDEHLDSPEQNQPIASRCEAVLFIVTPDWIESEWCRTQFDLFNTLNKPMVGIVTKAIDPDLIPVEFKSEWLLLDFSQHASNFVEQVALASDIPLNHGKRPQQFDELKRFLLSVSLDPDYLHWPPDTDPGRKPFRGLSSFSSDDGGVFFGRDQQIAEATDSARKLRKRGGFQSIFLSGAAGVGKSSMMRAGLLSRLEADTRHFIVLPPLEPATGAVYGDCGLLARIGSVLARFQLSDHPQRVHAAFLQTLAGTSNSNAKLTDLLTEIVGVSSRRSAPALRPSIIIAIDQLGDLFAHGDIRQNRDLVRVLRGFAEQTELSIILVASLCTGEIPRALCEIIPPNQLPDEIVIPPVPVAAYPQLLQRPLERYSSSLTKVELEGPLIEQLLNDISADDSVFTPSKVSLALKILLDQHKGGRKALVGELCRFRGIRRST